MHRVAIALALVAACGKKDDRAETGSAAPAVGSGASAVGSGSSAVVAAVGDAATPDAAAAATGLGYELAAANIAPPAGSVAGTEPPTAESLHLELSYALAKWAANPRDKSLYAADFEGRDIADGRVDFVGYDEWMTKLPAKPAQTRNASIQSWLDPGTQVTLGEAKVHVSYIYDDKDQYRQLMWRREGATWHLYKEQVNSQNSRPDDKVLALRNWLPTDAKPLGKQLTVRFGIENMFAWIVVENGKGAQVVLDIWPEGTCTQVETPLPDPHFKEDVPLGKLTCKDSGAGKDFVLVKSDDELGLRLYPAGKDAPMSTDHTIMIAKGAKVTLAPKTP
ncbi:MAG TPA: hypothetical protein VMZ53_08685 [Kofleriaceae bacterium]|nr:hypothetical protein [Kofleriaceae bacterium]